MRGSGDQRLLRKATLTVAGVSVACSVRAEKWGASVYRILGCFGLLPVLFFFEVWGNSSMSWNSDLCLTEVSCCCSCIGKHSVS